MGSPMREVELIYRFEEGPNRGTELRVFSCDRNHTVSSWITRIPTGELLWSETSRSNGPFFGTTVKDHVPNRFLTLVGLATRLAKDGARSD
jgi:hypothetical protein